MGNRVKIEGKGTNGNVEETPNISSPLSTPMVAITKSFPKVNISKSSMFSTNFLNSYKIFSSTNFEKQPNISDTEMYERFSSCELFRNKDDIRARLGSEVADTVSSIVKKKDSVDINDPLTDMLAEKLVGKEI